ncbi:esterase [Streptomyces odontomachi]|uniref:esterase n=1 Tax=Streptomyces odontomachi TaxID=2944940 RepID=UPI00210F02FA|nr:esterase [Streptomyces sp. ODS25]
MRIHRSAATVAASLLLMTGAVILTAPVASAGAPGGTRADDRNCDFNGDGYDDLLTGAPNAVASGSKGAGLVSVQYGGRGGLDTTHAHVFTRATPGIEGVANPQDHFGASVASGDLDFDGYDDAIIGIPGDDFSGRSNAGGVVILWGSADGLSGVKSTLLVALDPTPDAHFGSAVTAARFGGATPGDTLAVLDEQYARLFTYETRPGGVTGTLRQETESAAGQPARWSVQQLKLPAGTDTQKPQKSRRGQQTQKGQQTQQTQQDGSRVLTPRSLTTGDYDGNGYADLVISGVDEGQASDGTDVWHGWSAYLPGADDGVSWVRDLPGGPAVASGDINGDGYDDLVAGAPQPLDGGRYVGGMIAVHFGGPDGPGVADTQDQYWSQDSLHIPGVGEPGDEWGADVSVADTDGDGYADVAIGAPGEDRDAVADAGSVTVLRGDPGGLVTTGVRTWSQDSPDIPGADEPGDRWGAQVRLVDPDGNGRSDLLAAAPGENSGDGVLWFLPAASGGITATGSWSYGLGSLGSPHTGAAYGAAVDE